MVYRNLKRCRSHFGSFRRVWKRAKRRRGPAVIGLLGAVGSEFCSGLLWGNASARAPITSTDPGRLRRVRSFNSDYADGFNMPGTSRPDPEERKRERREGAEVMPAFVNTLHPMRSRLRADPGRRRRRRRTPGPAWMSPDRRPVASAAPG